MKNDSRPDDTPQRKDLHLAELLDFRPDQGIIRLRRVTLGSLVNLALLTFAAYALISVFGGVDTAALFDALADASWTWLAFALVLAQIPRIPAALSTLGS